MRQASSCGIVTRDVNSPSGRLTKFHRAGLWTKTIARRIRRRSPAEGSFREAPQHFDKHAAVPARSNPGPVIASAVSSRCAATSRTFHNGAMVCRSQSLGSSERKRSIRFSPTLRQQMSAEDRPGTAGFVIHAHFIKLAPGKRMQVIAIPIFANAFDLLMRRIWKRLGIAPTVHRSACRKPTHSR